MGKGFFLPVLLYSLFLMRTNDHTFDTTTAQMQRKTGT
jgi:hypothetical protein